ncbi:MAG: GNAT family N-acetyltransferase [Armatimonadetes bacterium]|nr:GNAT family N-acetyltransferase [Armatimonadota bacterium]
MIREMTEGDLPAVKALMQSIPGFWHEAWNDGTLSRALASAGDLALVYEEDGRIGGMVFCHDVGFRAYLSELAVAEEMRGMGIARKLLARVEEILRERGCEMIIADVWRSAESFYRELGWTQPDVTLLRKGLKNPPV